MSVRGQYHRLGDRAVVVELGQRIDEATFNLVQALSQHLGQASLPGLIEYVPAYTTITLYYDPLLTTHEQMCLAVEPLLAAQKGSPTHARTVEIPVCYGGLFGSDLEFVAEHNRLTTGDVIEIHSRATYKVHMLGFAPGFPYLGGMSQKIATPRHSTPRVKVPVGSVGIAGAQTGIYSLEAPGGWQIIGRTPLALFRPTETPPTLLSPGDLVRFRPITTEDFAALREGVA